MIYNSYYLFPTLSSASSLGGPGTFTFVGCGREMFRVWVQKILCLKLGVRVSFSAKIFALCWPRLWSVETSRLRGGIPKNQGTPPRKSDAGRS